MEKVAAIEGDVLILPHPKQEATRTNIFRARRIVVRGPVTLPAQSRMRGYTP